MKKAYENAASFVRWIVAGVVSLVMALPMFTSVSSSI